ncbi:hypothetical protein SDC9_204609 [bioreactor metagenome]|uniref:Uncharacterized protein n=1 Tax=bioreactor metagenome TaxID=1076179 RepID=A0A645J0E1_9ZZZZ
MKDVCYVGLPYFDEPREGRIYQSGKAISAATSNYVIVLCAPFYLNGQFNGVVMISISLEE